MNPSVTARRRFLPAAALLIAGLSAAPALAVPSLGVASGQGYVGATGQVAPEDYQAYFTGTFLPGTDATHGFRIGPSGSSLTLFTSRTNADIYLLTTNAVNSTNAPSFEVDGNPVTIASYTIASGVDGFHPKDEPYWGINLGLATLANGWTALPNSGPLDFPGADQFYTRSVQLAYTGSIAAGAYFFALADDDFNGPDKHDPNSPATTSAVGGGLYLPPPPDNPDQPELPDNPPGGPDLLNTTAVPEPVTGVMALLGLAGLTLTATRRRRR